jgi:hypothetical protein
MPLMCNECFNIFHKKYKASTAFCKYCNRYLVEVDENFIESISLLNKKGYTTKNCCSGHTNPKDVHHAYIQFEGHVVLPSLSNKYLYDECSYRIENDTIRIYFKSKDMLDLQKEILRSALDVLSWSKKL